MEDNIKQNVINHLGILGYNVIEKKYDSFTKLEAIGNKKFSIAVNLNMEKLIFLTRIFGLTMPKEKVNQKFLEALNKTNAKFMFTKVFVRENDKGQLVLYVTTCLLTYNERDFAVALDSLESNTDDYLKDLSEFTDFTT